MSRALVVALALFAFGCNDDIGKDSDPAHIRAALCLRVKRPPRARCEAAAKEDALNVVHARPIDGNFWMYSTECEEPLREVMQFAPGSPEQAQLREACCTIPGEQMREAVKKLCRPRPKDSSGRDM